MGRASTEEKKKETKKEEKKAAAVQKSASKPMTGGKGKKFSGNFGKKERFSPFKRNPDDPNLLYGRDFDDDPIELSTVVGEMGDCSVAKSLNLIPVNYVKRRQLSFHSDIRFYQYDHEFKMFVRNERSQMCQVISRKALF